MKIAARNSLRTLIAVVGLALVSPCAQAQTPGAVAPAPAPSTGPSVTAPGPSQDASPVKEVLDSIKVEEPSTKATTKAAAKKIEAEVDLDEEDEESIGDDKVPESVKGVVKKLSKATKDVTIEDLNAAREAVVKLDALIDIEKRLNDLSTLRAEREEKEGSMAGAIPDSALGKKSSGGAFAPPALTPNTAPAAVPPAPMYFPETNIEVKKIVGASANYYAMIKDVDGTEKRIGVGDKLSNGSTVESISRGGVTIMGTDKKKKTIQVKDISAVFGAR